MGYTNRVSLFAFRPFLLSQDRAFFICENRYSAVCNERIKARTAARKALAGHAVEFYVKNLVAFTLHAGQNKIKLCRIFGVAIEILVT